MSGSRLDKFLKWAEVHNRVVTFGLGTSILLYGSHAPTVVLLICAARASGIENTKTNIILLFESFSKTQKAITDARPELESSAIKITTLTNKLINLSQKYRNGEISLESHDAERDRINNNLRSLQNIAAKMTFTIYKVIQSIDFKKLEYVTHSILMSMASVIAVQSSEHAKLFSRAITVGSQLSNIFYDILSKYLKLDNHNQDGNSTNVISNALVTHEPLSDEDMRLRDAWHTAANLTGHLTGMFVTYMFRKISYIITSCSLGAELVTSAVQQTLDPILIENSIPIMRDLTIYNISPVNALHMGLFSYGLLQLTHRSTLLERILLMPLTTMETFLNILMFTKKI